MKQILFSMIMLLIMQPNQAQYKDTVRTRAIPDYALKSNNQKSSGWTLLGGGSALIAGGILFGNRKEATFDEAGMGAVMAGLGVISALGSIPLFLASKRNRRRAAGTAQITLQPGLLLRHSPAYPTLKPAAHFRLSF